MEIGWFVDPAKLDYICTISQQGKGLRRSPGTALPGYTVKSSQVQVTEESQVFVSLLFHFDEEMGQSQSKTSSLTPLECLTKNFSDFSRRAAGFGAQVDAFTLRKFCEREWPAFEVGWPETGSLDLGKCTAVHDVIFGNPRHPDQMPYIEIWMSIANDKPRYLRECQGDSKGKKKVKSRSRVLVIKGTKGDRFPRRPTAPPVLPTKPKSPIRLKKRRDENPPPYAGTSGATTAPEPDSTSGLPSGVLSPPNTRAGTMFGSESTPVGTFPLREVGELDTSGRPLRTYVLFSTSDLYNWKNQNPPFSVDPEGVATLLESVFYTHQPTWDDCQQLLSTLFTLEERERIKIEGKKQVRDKKGEPPTDQDVVEEVFPQSRPKWDPNTSTGYEALTRYRQTLLRGIRAAGRKPTNLSKVTECKQGADESPTAFLERLYQVYRTWTPIDPKAPENVQAATLQFVAQSAPDIRKKLQKLEGFEGKSLSELLAVAQKVFDNREDPAKATLELNKKMAQVLLAREIGNREERGRYVREKGQMKGKDKPLRGLRKTQCALCKEEGHWRKECPKRKEEEGKRMGKEAPLLPRVKLAVGGKVINFLVDTGATHSVLQQPIGPTGRDKVKIIGATGEARSYPKSIGRVAGPGLKTITHSFLVIPECPEPLLGRDLLHKLQATISFETNEGPIVQAGGRILLTMPVREEYRLYEAPQNVGNPDLLTRWKREIPRVWAETNPPGLAKHVTPIIVQLVSSATPVRVRQYPMSREAQHGIRNHIRRLKEAGILVPCKSAWNTPLLPVRKPGTNDFRPVQDLREVNKRVETIHPTVPNPYTLLSLLSPDRTWYSVLDLKDAFFSLPLAPQSQPIFAFEWTDPEEGESGQLTWTRLPQGFKNSPTLFDEALSKDLLTFRSEHPECSLLQYVDDLLIAALSREDCEMATRDLLEVLGNLGYRVSAKKVQLCTQEVTYLGYQIKEGRRALSEGRVQAILKILTPTTKRQVREFLGAVGYCRLWIPGFAELAKPLYTATGGGDTPLKWTEMEERAFQALKESLVSAPALGLPDLNKPFQLFVAESAGVAKGVLTQTLGPWKKPVAYLSKQLDPVAAGWPGCLRTVAAAALLVKETTKLTFGQTLEITTAHNLASLLRSPPDRWMTNSRVTHYQVLLLDPPRITFKQTAALNPATLLPNPEEDATHDCGEILEALTSLRADLTDVPLPDAQETLYTDGSSFVEDGVRYAGAVVVTSWEVLWAASLPQGSSDQKAELIALIQALKWGAGKKINVYTDSRYAFATVHVHGALYQERGLLTTGGKAIKHAQEILALLAAVWGPERVAVIHCKGHQKDDSEVSRGNRLADQTAREAAQRLVGTTAQLVVATPIPGEVTKGQKPVYSKQEEEMSRRLGGRLNEEG
ncbi:uncharacterized protein LOC132533385 [Erinaceus europaeus]|uniref:Uncharacterized protein LOC132533385 n=1 Tax=Erinaceus europaeus TaxID=9365 RepID=A0ABM3W0S4_ERIEU|nr:uncharacterized protein LOC132533385 [Erinaceus europaeus]